MSERTLDADVAAPDVVVGRYGELWLKGRNRGLFERALARNVRHALREVAEVGVERDHGQLLVRASRRAERVARRMEDVFGLSSVSLARQVPAEVDAIVRAGRAAVEEALAARPDRGPIPFRVQVKRADKTFPMISPELERHVAEAVLPLHADRLKVDLSHPELVLSVGVRPGRAFVDADRRRGPGGLPVGTMGTVVCLLSGGIDSPVAAWLAMKRGCEVRFVSFHSPPFLGEGSRRKVEALVRALGRYQPRSRLYVVPFADVQTRVRDAAPEGYRTVLYRRAMQRIAARIAAREGAGALVTGESLGQVASQTLENLTCIGAASPLPVLRPLVAFDKQETIALARRIGTYDLSILPEPDCCTVFQPRRPVIRGRIDRCEEVEAAIDAEALAERAAAAAELRDLGAA